MIELIKVSKKYGTFMALNDISLKIEKETITTIIGENGSGKSTLLNIIGRLNHCSEGSVKVGGVDIQKIPHLEYAKQIATLKQNNTLNLRLKVKDLVAFGRYPHNQGRLTQGDDKIIQDSMDFMECGELQEQFLDQLSGGQVQRVYIAMILAQDTEVMLLDEPLNNLDLRHAHELMILIQKLVRECKKTVVMIVHDLNMVYRYGDNVIALKKGQLLCQGPVNEVLTQIQLKKLYDMDFTIQSTNTHKIAFIA